jgi:glutathionylspermidine synthase
MKLVTIGYSRPNFESKLEEKGFGFHKNYWDETRYFEFSMDEVLTIEKATNALFSMYLTAIQHVIDNKMYHLFGIPEWFQPLIEESWNEDHPSIYGRFDFVFKDGIPKLLEFNADTPTSLVEAAIAQWFWKEDLFKQEDQFNSLHESLIDYWKYLKPYLNSSTVYFTCVKNSHEDLTTVEYIRDCAIQAGIDTKLIFIDDIGWDGDKFLDLEEKEIKSLFKLYPWEWMINDNFGVNLLVRTCQFIEPAWKILASSKALLPILWDLFPDCPYILRAETKPLPIDYVEKPIYSREGSNVSINQGGLITERTKGPYITNKSIYQEYCEIPEFDGLKPIIGSWVVGQVSHGMGIRASENKITSNKSLFIPHIIKL